MGRSVRDASAPWRAGTSQPGEQPDLLRSGAQVTRRVAMKGNWIQAVVVSLALSMLAVVGGGIAAQDTGQAKYTVRVPNGLEFSEFRGYEGWQTISISHNEKVM